MKQIINGKRYDTEASGTVKVAEWDNGLGWSDFGHCEEKLYRTARGAWFVAGSGGAMTGYARECGDMRTGGEAICPITPDEAMGWLESHGFTAEMEVYFTSAIEDA